MIEHWAAFFEDGEAVWVYGAELESEFITTTARFLRGLHLVGKEVYSEGVATIRLARRSMGNIRATEVFVISLGDKFIFVMSDPLVTIRLVSEPSNLPPPEVIEMIRGVLAGQAAVLYANLLQNSEVEQIDSLFVEILKEIGIEDNIENIVDSGRCSFATLNFPELLFLHYLLRDRFEESRVHLPAWGFVSGSSGVPVFLDYQTPFSGPLLSGFLSVMSSYVRTLFDSPPSIVIFGGSNLFFLHFFGGENSFLAASNPMELVRSKEFWDMYRELDEFIRNEIDNDLQYCLIEEFFSRSRSELKTWSLEDLRERFNKEL